ncbi:hypothetical protein CLIB1444_03S03180 [[Candida] jaroonii]|uniref:Uncharacterized protein n=1 Tax=[Candida] jaroonii TaxID=467808 RepID=A0ACA9Y5J3_9ASCO|nr:hypothetical protein CLIB1444_03S03180 [[Candida] jaroonii]
MNSSIDKTTNEPYAKHAKITPKKKPIPIAVLPKPSVPKSTFNPSIKTSKLKNDIALNINTSKKWILPPRPRPGRKPVAEATSPMGSSPMVSSVSNISTAMGPSASNASNISVQSTSSSTSNVAPIPNNSERPEDPELHKLKLSYLEKLKEQELIFNYIDIINNQINQLDFIKNGFISHDTLNQIEHEKIVVENNVGGRVQELENINNNQDLNKFLNYMIKSSNLIHRVTKNYQGNINDQIDKYMKLRKNNLKRDNKEFKAEKKISKLGQNLLNEGNIFDKLVINDEFTCGICKKSSPCFCLDIDKKK